MATIKSYTDLEQSKKLAEILPLKSADMCWAYRNDVDRYFLYVKNSDTPEERLCQIVPYEKDVPAWSLSALLEALDDEITDEEGNDYTLTIIKENLQYQLYYHDAWGQAEDIETDYYDDMIDACYEMIVKIHERGLL